MWPLIRDIPWAQVLGRQAGVSLQNAHNRFWTYDCREDGAGSLLAWRAGLHVQVYRDFIFFVIQFAPTSRAEDKDGEIHTVPLQRGVLLQTAACAGSGSQADVCVH